MHYLDIELDGIDEHGKEKKYKLSDFNGEKVIIYFYPQDGTPVCTEEAHQFRDEMEELKKFGTVIGVSENDIESHKEFQELHKLNFIMLSDKENKLKQAFEEHLKTTPTLHRSTFVLGKDGEIIKVWEKVDIEDHLNNIKKFIKEHLHL